VSETARCQAMTANSLVATDTSVSLSRYLRQVADGAPVPGSGLGRLIGSLIPRSYRGVARRIATSLAAPLGVVTAKKLARRAPLQLHLGCGEWPKPGWVNVDLVGLPVDLAWNLNTSLPFSDGTVDAIFHEHVLEHLELERGLALLEESYRLLKPGGVLRIGVPDASRYVGSYCDPNHSFLERVRPGRPTALLALQEEFYGHGHRTMYDFATLALVCHAAGFPEVEQHEIGDSRLMPAPDSEHRRLDTLYVEMTRPLS
jgi:predicted SAM-dependent methyltransferase